MPGICLLVSTVMFPVHTLVLSVRTALSSLCRGLIPSAMHTPQLCLHGYHCACHTVCLLFNIKERIKFTVCAPLIYLFSSRSLFVVWLLVKFWHDPVLLCMHSHHLGDLFRSMLIVLLLKNFLKFNLCSAPGVTWCASSIYEHCYFTLKIICTSYI
jgi:hypothetical protein